MNLSRRYLRGCICLVATTLCWNQFSAPSAQGQQGRQSAQKSTAIHNAIIERIEDRWNLSGPRHAIELRRNPFLAAEFDTPGSFDSISITPLTRKNPRGAFPMLIDIFQSGRSVRHGQVSAFVEVFDSILVVERRSPKGTLAADLTLKLQFRKITDISEACITNESELEGMRLRRNVQPGDALTWPKLEPIPDVDFGQEVVIEFSGGGLTLSAAGSAMQKGITGETVRVRNLSSRKIIKAVVAGPGLVRIAAGGVNGRTR